MGFVDLIHRNAAEQHAMKRLFERHNIALSRPEYREFSEKCAEGHWPAVASGFTGNTIHKIRVRDRDVYAIFSAELGVIVTFLKGIPNEVRCAATQE